MNKKFKELVLSYGMTVNGNFAHGTVKGYETNATIQVTETYGPVMIHISFYATEEQKRSIDAALTNAAIKRFRVTFSPFGLTLGLNEITVGAIVKKLPAILDTVYAIISENGGLGSEYCPVCGKPFEEGNNKDCNIDGFTIRLDNDCVEKMNSVITAENQQFENAPNNYLKGFIGAVIGGVVGALCAVVFFMFGLISAISAVVSVVLGAFLYEKFGGKPNKMMLLIVAATTVIFMALTVLLIYMWAAGVLYESFSVAMQDSEFASEFYSNLLMSLLFSAIGIGIEIYYKARKIKRRKNI